MARKNKIQVGAELQGRADALVSDEITYGPSRRRGGDSGKGPARRLPFYGPDRIEHNRETEKTDKGLKLRDASTWSSELVLQFMRHTAGVISDEVARLPITADEQADFIAAVATRLEAFFYQSRNSADAIKLLECTSHNGVTMHFLSYFGTGQIATIRRIRRWLQTTSFHNIPITTIRPTITKILESRTTVANVREALLQEGYTVVNGRAIKPRGTKNGRTTIPVPGLRQADS